MENTSMRATTEYNEMLELLQLTYMKAEELCDELKQCLNKLKENKNISELSQLIHTQKESAILFYTRHINTLIAIVEKYITSRMSYENQTGILWIVRMSFDT